MVVGRKFSELRWKIILIENCAHTRNRLRFTVANFLEIVLDFVFFFSKMYFSYVNGCSTRGIKSLSSIQMGFRKKHTKKDMNLREKRTQISAKK